MRWSQVGALTRGQVAVVLAVVVAVGGPAVAGTAPDAPDRTDASVAAAAPGSTTLAVSGGGAVLRPAFDPGITRYGVAATDLTEGEVTVEVTPGEVGATARVDGRLVTGPTTVTGLETGDEISVIVTDSAGVHAYALVYLPPSFPVIDEATPDVDGPVAEGAVLLTMGDFAMALDRHGVPLLLRDFGQRTSDLKPAPHGHYTLMLRRPGAASDWDLVELDEGFDTVSTSRAVGLGTTDNHDSVVLPDGTRYFLSYDPDPVTGLVDPVIQEVDPAGDVVHTWDGGIHLGVAETTAGSDPDWAHINSIQVLPDGDILASFRHLSSIVKIAWSDRAGVQWGDVVWRLGGRLNDFTFHGDPHGGTCAQHTAAVLPNGHLLVYDNGSGALGENPSYCLDPADRDGATVQRTFTRVVEYALDEVAMTATVVNDWRPRERFSYFAGSARRLPNGHTLVGWASEPDALVSELDGSGRIVWELQAPQPPNPPLTLSYRAEKATVPDAIAPEVALRLPGSARYEMGDRVVADIGCTDRGGSTLQSCASSVVRTDVPGARSHVVEAVDGAGNRTTARRTYTVVPPSPGISVRDAGAWRAKDRIRFPHRGSRHRAVLRLTNDSGHPRTLALAGSRPGPAYRVRYRHAGKDVTAAVRAGLFRTPVLAAGQTTQVLVRVVRRSPEPRVRRLHVRVSVPGAAGATDAVTLVLRGR